MCYRFTRSGGHSPPATLAVRHHGELYGGGAGGVWSLGFHAGMLNRYAPPFVPGKGECADEEERDLIPPPMDLDENMLEELGDQMLARIEQLRDSTIEKLHVRGRAAMLRAISH
jgi:hypothetical protein